MLDKNRLLCLLLWLPLLLLPGCGGDDDGILFQDTLPPVITLTGENPQIIALGGPYVELGATAYDDVDGDISHTIVINSASLDVNAEAVYSVYYSVTDTAGNAAQAIRTVQVVDQAVPVITPPPAPLTVSGYQPDTLTLEPGSSIMIHFSEELLASSVDITSVQVVDELGSPVSGYTLKVNQNVVVISPPGTWADGDYVVTVTTAVTGVGGGTLASAYSFPVTSDSAASPTVFEIASTSPADGEVNVVLGSDVVVTFTTPVDFTTVPGGIKLYDELRQVPGAWSIAADGLTITFTPDLPLSPNVSSYTIEFVSTLTDLDGEVLHAGAVPLVFPHTRVFDTAVAGWTDPDFATAFWDRAWIVAVDAAGYLYVAGSTEGAIEAGFPVADRDAFLAKFAPDGSIAWIRQVDIAGDDDGLSVAVDRYGYAYLAGSSGTLEGFVVRFPPSGSRLSEDGYWQQVGFSGDPEEFYGIAADWNGNLFAVGYADDGINTDLLIYKLAAQDGTVLDSKRIDSPANGDLANAVTFDPVSGSIYVVADYSGDFSPDTNAGSTDALLLRYENDPAPATTFSLNGSHLFGTAAFDSALAVATAPDGDVIMGGLSDATIEAASAYSSLVPVGYFVRFDTGLGEFWREEISGLNSTEDGVTGLAVDGNDLVYGAGISRERLDAASGNSSHRLGYFFQYDFQLEVSVPADYLSAYLIPSSETLYEAIATDVEVTPAGDLVFLGASELGGAEVPVLVLVDDTFVQY